MANMMEMMKQAATMRKEMKRIQKELARKTVEFSNGGVSVVARGDMSIQGVTINPETVDLSDANRLARQITTAVNGALSAAKKQAGSEMSQLTSGLGLPGM